MAPEWFRNGSGNVAYTVRGYVRVIWSGSNFQYLLMPKFVLFGALCSIVVWEGLLSA